MADVSKIKLPNGTTYDIKDKISGYTTNTGTVTSVAVSGGTGISINGSPITSSGTITVTNTGATGVKGNAESSYRTGQVNLTAANVGAIPANSNGNTQNLYRPIYLNGLNDNTLDQKISTLRANRLAFLPADQIIIEKTIDGGTTWIDAEVTDDIKLGLFSETRNSVYIPLLNGVKDKKCGIRITFTAMKYNVPSGTAETNKYNYWNSTYVVSQERYNQLKEMYFWVNANSDTIGVKLERATGAASTTWDTIFDNTSFCMTGWSGNDYIRFSQGVFGGGTNQTTNYWNYRLTFMTKGTSASHGDTMSTSSTTQAQSIMEIRGYGDTWWEAGNNYAAEDKIYTHDKYQNVIFPGSIYPATNNTKTLGSSSYKWNSIYATTFEGNATSASALGLSSDITGSTLDTFKDNSKAKIARITTSGPSGDGIVLWLPWSSSYGRQLCFEEAANNKIYSRTLNNGAWGDWEEIVYPWKDNAVLYGGVDTGLGSGTPASNVKTYYADSTKVPNAKLKMFQNSSGVEYTSLFSRRSESYGSVLKWGYNDKYMRILRIKNGTWQSDDWEKIDAGNADTVGGHTVGIDVPANAVFTDSGGTVTSVGLSNATNGGLTVSGSPVTSSGTITIGHSNVLTSAQTTQAVYPIKIDKNGHISAYGNAITIPSDIVSGSGSTDYLAKWSNTNTLSTTSIFIGTSYNSSSDLYGTIKLYIGSTGQLDWKGQLVFYSGDSSKTITITPPSLTSSRTLTLPDKTGTIALTSDIPTVSYPVTSVNNKTGAVSLTASDVGALASSTTYVSTITTTAGTHTAISSKSGAVSFNVPTKTSHLTNDSGFLTGITSSQVTTALGYTPYNSTNPNGYTSNTGTVTKVTAGTGLSIGTTAGGNFTTSGTINHTNSVTAQTTQAVYPIKIDAQGHISAYGSAVTIPTVPSNIVNTITTTAGTHTAISSATGAVSFNVPTKTSHLTNDSGFLTSYTETDPTVPSWAKASTKPSYNFSEIGNKPTTISDYGITDAKISNGTVTLGSNTITPLTESSTLFYYDTFTASNYDFTANQYRSLTKSITARTGYSRIIISVRCTSHSGLQVFNWSLSENTITYEVINRTSSSISGANFVMNVLYIKSSLIGS